MTIAEFVLVLHKLDKGVLPRQELIAGLMREINCQEKHREGKVVALQSNRVAERERVGHWGHYVRREGV